VSNNWGAVQSRFGKVNNGTLIPVLRKEVVVSFGYLFYIFNIIFYEILNKEKQL